jgi:hypothetical protein
LKTTLDNDRLRQTRKSQTFRQRHPENGEISKNKANTANAKTEKS